MSKEKRYNIKDDFENLYLRSKTLKRFLNKADPNILKDKEFKRVVNYIAGRFYFINKGVYQLASFDYDDIHSMAQIYGLAFTGCGFEAETTKEKYTVMMSFISQRLIQATGWIIKKFQIDELAPKQMVSFDSGVFDNIRGLNELSPVIIDGVCLSEKTPSSCKEIEDKRLNDNLDFLTEEVTRHDDDQETRKEIKKEIKRLDQERKKTRETAPEKLNLQNMRIELKDNWEKYTDDLAFYSVSRFVSSDVRKKARSICKKYGINYKEWASQKIADNVYTNEDFCEG